MSGVIDAFLIVLVALMTAGGQAAPISGYNSSPSNSTVSDNSTTNATTDATAISSNVTALKVKAVIEIYSIYTEITELENYTVRHQIYNIIVEHILLIFI